MTEAAAIEEAIAINAEMIGTFAGVHKVAGPTLTVNPVRTAKGRLEILWFRLPPTMLAIDEAYSSCSRKASVAICYLREVNKPFYAETGCHLASHVKRPH
jgi:hypothetical protein